MRLFAAGERLRESASIDVRAVVMQLDVASVYKVVNYLTRLETRIAEFSVAASQWAQKPRGAMKVNVHTIRQ